jgi:hypothetical protein
MLPTKPSAGTAALKICQSMSSNTCGLHIPGHSCQSRLVQEARSIVTVEQGLRIEDASSEILQINAGEAVGGTCVASHAENTRICSIANL